MLQLFHIKWAPTGRVLQRSGFSKNSEELILHGAGNFTESSSSEEGAWMVGKVFLAFSGMQRNDNHDKHLEHFEF